MLSAPTEARGSSAIAVGGKAQRPSPSRPEIAVCPQASCAVSVPERPSIRSRAAQYPFQSGSVSVAEMGARSPARPVVMRPIGSDLDVCNYRW